LENETIFINWLKQQIEGSIRYYTPGGQKVAHNFWMTMPTALILKENIDSYERADFLEWLKGQLNQSKLIPPSVRLRLKQELRDLGLLEGFETK